MVKRRSKKERKYQRKEKIGECGTKRGKRNSDRIWVDLRGKDCRRNGGVGEKVENIYSKEQFDMTIRASYSCFFL